MGDYSVVGKSVMRVDALEKVTGKAVYCTDIKLPGMLHVKVLRSPYPHAKIISIDTTKAVKLSGVKCVLTSDDVPSNRYGSVVRDSTILAQGVVRAVGEPVVAVAAETVEAAEEDAARVPRAVAAPAKVEEQRRVDCEEVQQRLTNQAGHDWSPGSRDPSTLRPCDSSTLRAHFGGVYQMGEVYARSCKLIGTSLGIWMPKRFASYAVQRGVGISMTRP